jgi:hypothetical protein
MSDPLHGVVPSEYKMYPSMQEGNPANAGAITNTHIPITKIAVIALSFLLSITYSPPFKNSESVLDALRFQNHHSFISSFGTFSFFI